MFINYLSQRLFGCIYAHKAGEGSPLDLCDRIIFDFNMNVTDNDNDSCYVKRYSSTRSEWKRTIL